MLTTSRKDARLGLSARGAWPVLCALSSSKRAPRCCSLLDAEGGASAGAAAFGCWSAAPGDYSFSPPSLQPMLSMDRCIPCAPGAHECHTPPLLTALSIGQCLCCLSGLGHWYVRQISRTSDLGSAHICPLATRTICSKWPVRKNTLAPLGSKQWLVSPC